MFQFLLGGSDDGARWRVPPVSTSPAGSRGAHRDAVRVLRSGAPAAVRSGGLEEALALRPKLPRLDRVSWIISGVLKGLHDARAGIGSHFVAIREICNCGTDRFEVYSPSVICGLLPNMEVRQPFEGNAKKARVNEYRTIYRWILDSAWICPLATHFYMCDISCGWLDILDKKLI